MESLSEVSEYLRNLEEMFKDSGDSLEHLENMLEDVKVDVEKVEEVGENRVCLPNEKRVVVFTRAPPKEFDAPFMRFATPCSVEGIKAWYAQLNLEYGDNYITEDVLDKLGFVRLDYEDYGRKKVRDVRVNIHGHIFKVDFVVLEYGNGYEPEVVFGRDFLVTTKCKIDFALGEMRIDITELEEEKEVDVMLAELCEGIEEVKEGKEEIVKMGKASRKKAPLNKLTQPSTPKNDNSSSSSSNSPPKSSQTVKPLTQEQKEAILENLEMKFNELMEKKPVIDVLNNYMTYRKKLDAVMMARSRLEDKSFDEVERERIVENGLPKKMSDPGNFVLPIKVNGTTPMYALDDTGSSVSVMPYPLYKRLGLSNPQPNQSNLTMAAFQAALQPPYQQPPPPIGNVHAPSSFNSGWGDWNRELNDIERRDVWRDSMMMRNNYNYDYSMPILQHMVREANYEVPPYNPPNIPPYPFQYDPYPGLYPYPYPGYAPFPEPVPVYGRVPNVGGSNYDVGGSSSGVGKKRQKVYLVFDEDENYEEEDEESENERIHTPDDMEDDDE